MNLKTTILTIAELIDAIRFIPRLILIGFAILVWIVVQWYMELLDPSTQQAALVTAVVGSIAPIVAFYQSTGRKWNNNS